MHVRTGQVALVAVAGIVYLLVATVFCLVSLTQADNLLGQNGAYVGSLGPTFDSVLYRKERIQLQAQHWIEDTVWFDWFEFGHAYRLFRTRYPQAFWQRVYADKPVSEVYFVLERTTEGSDFGIAYCIDAVFRADSSYYLTSWDAPLYFRITNDSLCLRFGDTAYYYYSPDSTPRWYELVPVELEYTSLSQGDVRSFLEHIDSAHHPLEMESFTYRGVYGPGTIQWYAFLYTSYNAHHNLVYAINCRRARFETLEELKDFYNALFPQYPPFQHKVDKLGH